MTIARSKPPRRGVVLLLALVCVVLAMTLFVAVVRVGIAGRKMTDAQQWQAQAAWLAESGLDRAAWRLAEEPDYQGETWTLAPAELGGTDAGVVEIQIEPVADRPDRRLVRVRADFPDAPHHRWRESREAVVQLSTQLAI